MGRRPWRSAVAVAVKSHDRHAEAVGVVVHDGRRRVEPSETSRTAPLARLTDQPVSTGPATAGDVTTNAPETAAATATSAATPRRRRATGVFDERSDVRTRCDHVPEPPGTELPPTQDRRRSPASSVRTVPPSNRSEDSSLRNTTRQVSSGGQNEPDPADGRRSSEAARPVEGRAARGRGRGALACGSEGLVQRGLGGREARRPDLLAQALGRGQQGDRLGVARRPAGRAARPRRPRRGGRATRGRRRSTYASRPRRK